MQPGEVVGPGTQPEKPQQPTTEVQPPAPEPANSVSLQDTESSEPKTTWEFSEQDDVNSVSEATPPQHEPVIWTASEYIAHDKTLSWYLILGISVVVFSIMVYIFTRETISSIVIIIMGVAFGAFAVRKPQELTYILDNTSLSVGGKPYPYSQFKSFSILQEGGIHSITLMPLQRFMPPLSIYFEPNDEDKIVDALSAYLPVEDRQQDFIDRFMKKVKF